MSSSQYPVEMHCHTVFSPDAKRTPEELVERAAARGVHTLAITDHNHLGAQERAARRADELGLRYVRGVEIDAIVPNGRNCHFVCFDYDLHNADLSAVVERRASQYPISFLEIFPYLKDYGCDISLDEMNARLPERYPTNPQATVNQWYARDLLMEKKLISDRTELGNIVRDIRKKIREKSPAQPLPQTSFEEMRNAVHSAGGKVLLAHVARYYRGDMDTQLAQIKELLNLGMDGFELYHPDNVKEPDFARLEDFARHSDCLLSSGSDCHDIVDETRNQYFTNMLVQEWFLERMV